MTVKLRLLPALATFLLLAYGSPEPAQAQVGSLGNYCYVGCVSNDDGNLNCRDR